MAEISKYFDQFININDTYRLTSNNQTLQTMMNLWFKPSRMCLSNVNGRSNKTYYDEFGLYGFYYNAYTKKIDSYTCN